jgi:hypothetical protein
MKLKIKFNPFYSAMSLFGMAMLVAEAVLMRTEILKSIWISIVIFGCGAAFCWSGTQRVFRPSVKWRDPKLAEKERNEENDERNELITAKARAKLYEFTQSAELLIFIFLCMDKEISDLYCYAMLGVLLVQGITEVILRRIYERRF